MNADYLTINNIKITILIDNDKQSWFDIKEIAKILGYVDTSDKLIKAVDYQYRCFYKDININDKSKDIPPYNVYINEDGLKSALCYTRSFRSVDIGKYFGIKMYNYKYVLKETGTLAIIASIFENEKMTYNFSVFHYKIDLYFPDYNLAVECDE